MPSEFGRIQISKVDADKRIVLGWAYKSLDAAGAPYVDHSGEHIPMSELEALPAPWGDSDTSGSMHCERGLARLIGWLTVDAQEREALGFGPGDQGLVVKMRIVDDALWKRIKSGELTALSIEGEAEKVPNA